MFAYCGNEPVNRYDVGGMFWKEAIRGITLSLIHISGEERMQFESLRRGEISPDLEDQKPDEEE